MKNTATTPFFGVNVFQKKYCETKSKKNWDRVVVVVGCCKSCRHPHALNTAHASKLFLLFLFFSLLKKTQNILQTLKKSLF